MDELAAAGHSGLVVRDRYDADTWRVYFQGQLTTQVFIGRIEALRHLGALRSGAKKPTFAKAYQGQEIRRETRNS
jgi:hypothetical protein